MKIVLPVHHFPPTYSAGAEVYTFRLANWLMRHGHEVEVVCVESITFDGREEIEHRHELYDGISVWRLYFDYRRAPDPFHRSFDNPLIGKWLTGFLRQARPQIVHLQGGYLLSASAIEAVKQASLPLVVTLHDFWFVCPRLTLLKPTGAVCRVPDNVAECAWCLATERRRFRWLDIASRGAAGALALPLLAEPGAARLFGIYPDAQELARRREQLMSALKRADMILSPSEFLRRIFVEQGIDPARIIYSRLGLDTSHWAAPLEPAPASAETLRLAYIGQVARHKGVDLLVKAFNRLDRSRRPAQLKIYGGLGAFPDYARALQGLARGNPAIEFAGRFDNSRIAEILQQTDAVVVPSIWYENSPVTIAEALATGTPVLASNLGAMPELVRHNWNGLLFKAGDVDDLTCQLQRLLDEPGLVSRLAANAHAVRLIDDEMAQLVSLYESVAAR
jgi:glycosyltransferase involved in cell wall biosynthesis